MNEKEYIQFLHLAEKLKDNTRHSVTSGGREESVAEHSWRVALMATHTKEQVDFAVEKLTECFKQLGVIAG